MTWESGTSSGCNIWGSNQRDRAQHPREHARRATAVIKEVGSAACCSSGCTRCRGSIPSRGGVSLTTERAANVPFYQRLGYGLAGYGRIGPWARELGVLPAELNRRRPCGALLPLGAAGMHIVGPQAALFSYYRPAWRRFRRRSGTATRSSASSAAAAWPRSTSPSDLRHDRPVALKVLHPELAATLGPERFQREIQLAARLQHPHILTVLRLGRGRRAGSGSPCRTSRARACATGSAGSGSSRWTTRSGSPARPPRARLRPPARRRPPRHQAGEHPAHPGRHALVADFGIARALGSGRRAADRDRARASARRPT